MRTTSMRPCAGPADSTCWYVFRCHLAGAPETVRLVHRKGGHDGCADSGVLARMTAGMSPARFAKHCNKAASTAAEARAPVVTTEHFLRAIETYSALGVKFLRPRPIYARPERPARVPRVRSRIGLGTGSGGHRRAGDDRAAGPGPGCHLHHPRHRGSASTSNPSSRADWR